MGLGRPSRYPSGAPRSSTMDAQNCERTRDALVSPRDSIKSDAARGGSAIAESGRKATFVQSDI